jgi:fructoselysine-6-P-deglycase FrlB-like protein
MNSIESLRLDFNAQVSELGKINNDEISDRLIFVGSGDSYVAGLIAEYLTNHKCKCYSPSDLLNSKFDDDKTYCFVSVTGSTKSNITVASRATESGVNTIAVTMNKDSMLSQACKGTIPIDFKNEMTPITIFSKFSANVVTCLQIAGVKIPDKLDIWHYNGVQLSQKFRDPESFADSMNNLTLVILGNNILYPLALYASLKMTEFFGTTAVAHKLEEFCHAPIFGIKKSHHLWLLGQKEQTVRQKLSRLGLKLSYIELYNQDILSQLFESIFFVQNLILLLAKKHGYTELHYLMMKDVLKTSSDIIYCE